MNYEMPLLRYSGLLEVLEKSKMRTIDRINKMDFPDVARKILKEKTEEFLVSGLDHILDPFKMTNVELEVLNEVRLEIKEAEFKLFSHMVLSAVSSVTEALVMNQAARDKAMFDIKNEQQGNQRSPFLSKRDAVELLGKKHMEHSGERLASNPTT